MVARSHIFLISSSSVSYTHLMYKGKFAGFFNDVEHVTEDELGQHMLGIKKDEVLEGVMYE